MRGCARCGLRLFWSAGHNRTRGSEQGAKQAPRRRGTHHKLCCCCCGKQHKLLEKSLLLVRLLDISKAPPSCSPSGRRCCHHRPQPLLCPFLLISRCCINSQHSAPPSEAPPPRRPANKSPQSPPAWCGLAPPPDSPTPRARLLTDAPGEAEGVGGGVGIRRRPPLVSRRPASPAAFPERTALRSPPVPRCDRPPGGQRAPSRQRAAPSTRTYQPKKGGGEAPALMAVHRIEKYYRAPDGL